MRNTSSLERSSGSLEYLVVSFGALRLAEVIRAAAGSLGGGGRGDLIFPAPTGGGASPRVLGFPLPESAADNIPVPLDGLGFTFIRMVSPSYAPQKNSQIRATRIANHSAIYIYRHTYIWTKANERSIVAYDLK